MAHLSRPGSYRRSCISRKGMTTVVEMAIVAPIFFIMIFGMIEIGRGFMAIHILNNAARAGCRVAIIEGKATSDVKTVVNNFLAGQGGVSGQTITTTVNGASADVSTAKAGDQITVSVSVPASQVTWLPAADYLAGTLSGQYSLRRE